MPENPPAVSVEAITVAFGGVVALDDVSLEVGNGEIVGLLGPNGAGKTTLLNVISGHLRSPFGRIRILGQEVSSLSTERRVKLGLGRSYQDARLFPGLTVREAVQLGLTSGRSVGFTAALVSAPWARLHERALRHRADEVIEQFGLGSWADSQLAHLSTGTRRACDVAVRVAAGSRLLLLDEPTAGLAQSETAAIGALLRRVSVEVGCSMIVVEHDIPFILGLADRLYALEAGRMIADGPPAHLRSHPAVLASYLGTTDVR